MTAQQAEPQDIIIFGATGDLARRKLLPALFRIHNRGLLPPAGRLIGMARSSMEDAAFSDLVREAVTSSGQPDVKAEEDWQSFASRLSYVGLGDTGYDALAEQVQQDRRLLYLSIPPAAYESTIREVAAHNLNKGARIVVEKPFGHDLDSAREIGATLNEAFNEAQIFRIDHYLGKETVQNILVLRFGNSIFERIWNRDAIDHIELTIAESAGIEDRGNFYEAVGALRDIVQNHALQILALLTMEAPVSPEGEAIRDEKLKLLRAIKPVLPADVVRGQYTAGTVDGSEVPGYREHEGVNQDSTTETYAALRLFIDNWRWAGVPVYLRTGKRLQRRVTEIEVVFKEVPKMFFEKSGLDPLRPNHLTIQVQPDEQICLSFVVKTPGPELQARQADLRYSYAESYDDGSVQREDAYEKLLIEAMEGDSTLFVREDSVERAWSILQPALDSPSPVHFYASGTWGPPEANALIAPESWHLG